MNKIRTYIFALLITSFDMLTLSINISMILNSLEIGVKKNSYILLMAWEYFLSSIICLFNAYRFIKTQKRISLYLAISIIALIITFIGLFNHIDMNTSGAMALSAIITVTIITLIYLTVKKTITKKIYIQC